MRNVRITKTRLGPEDHGIFTGWIFLDGHGIGGGFGGFGLGPYAEKWITGVMKCAGVDCWEDLPGKYIRAEGLELGSTIISISHIIEDDITFSVEEWRAMFKAGSE